MCQKIRPCHYWKEYLHQERPRQPPPRHNTTLYKRIPLQDFKHQEYRLQHLMTIWLKDNLDELDTKEKKSPTTTLEKTLTLLIWSI